MWNTIHKNNIVLFKVYLFVLTVSEHNSNHDAIFHCAVSRRWQLLSYFALFFHSIIRCRYSSHTSPKR
jgi:hypothetical protein